MVAKESSCKKEREKERRNRLTNNASSINFLYENYLISVVVFTVKPKMAHHSAIYHSAISLKIV